MVFLGISFIGPGDLSGFTSSPRGFFFVLIYFPIPHSHLPGLSLEIQSTPPPREEIYTTP